MVSVILVLKICGDERIIVFTTNHKDRLDLALLRPGRMDMHINMSYCTAGGFNILASNYLGIHHSNRHRLCGGIEGLIESSEFTPAEVAEELLRIDNADVALEGLVSLLKGKKVERNEAKEEGGGGGGGGDNKVEIQDVKRQKTESNVNGDNQNMLQLN
ncbi:putative ATPase, AAA-type, P-loop containing nucleoside triphosphate hydrolase [Rosa chinensis]|uniref:Putative ATPase, AAA-type, P-loop containing nucleoside triphosphate hydrolase n=1 Tax=Rosa chinensis TaxID=74649 RepID=A0A2P6RFD7_ROSCH|nr:putative ATPase, AAA-type, P-loop containing nucleoside triphosphate hydrolase [Rosa chinensis]